jgi:hypothetical protein
MRAFGLVDAVTGQPRGAGDRRDTDERHDRRA